MKGDLKALLQLVITKGASDLHISCGNPPRIRIDERLQPTEYDVITAEDSKEMAYSIMTEKQKQIFEATKELDMSIGFKGISRFRVNVYQQRGVVGAAFRVIPYKVKSFEQCGLPADVITSLCRKPKGLVLVTGATGSGKSTTLAAMIDYINQNRECHIITIEDPVEFLHEHKKSLIEQRELGNDTLSFGEALKHILRQDPDVILVGEMRDLETIESALLIAETGHLVFATLHTSDCVQTINRIIDVFPAHQQSQIRTQLSFVLQGILSQQLVPLSKGTGRSLALELLILNPAVRSLIREGKNHQIASLIQTGHKEGMRTMNQSLADLYQRRMITYEDAMSRTADAVDLARLLHK